MLSYDIYYQVIIFNENDIIIEKINPQKYRLNLFKKQNIIHKIFHVLLLKS